MSKQTGKKQMGVLDSTVISVTYYASIKMIFLSLSVSSKLRAIIRQFAFRDVL